MITMQYASKIAKDGTLTFPSIPGMSRETAQQYVMMSEALDEMRSDGTDTGPLADHYRETVALIERGHVSARPSADDTPADTPPASGGNSRTGNGRPSRAMSDAQYNFIKSLAESRDTGCTFEDYMTMIDKGRVKITKSTASAMIETLKSSPFRSRPEPATSKGDSLSEGMYWTRDGNGMVRVQRSQAGRLYGKRLNEETHAFEYAPGCLRDVDPDRPVTLDDASAYGLRTHHCLECSRQLTNPESIARGIGPVCAGKF